MESGLVSAEEYLRTNHIEELLEEIVTSLLQHRPSNPRKHIASLMNDTTPFPSSQAPRGVVSGGNGNSFPRSGVSSGGQRVQPSQAGRRFSAVSAEALMKSRESRRQGFSSKSISNTTMVALFLSQIHSVSCIRTDSVLHLQRIPVSN